MRAARLLLLVALGLAAAPACARAEAVTLDRAKLASFVDGAVLQALDFRHFAGLSIAVVDRDGVALARGYGIAGLNPRRPARADTLFRVGSISKTVVWIAVMQLVEQGKISLDDPINDHLPPALRIPDEGFREPIRIRHLMTHSAGFEDTFEGLFSDDPARLVPLDDYLRTHRPHRVREAGTLAVYSNYGAALAGALVAHVAGEAWADYAERHVLRPLGMATATYRGPYPAELARARGLPDPMPAELAAKLTDGFSWSNGAYRAHPFEYVNTLPAGELSASADDMAAYMRALLDPDLMEKSGVLRKETALEMRKPMFANYPGLGQIFHGFMDYSIGRGRPAFGHGGALTYQYATMQIYPEDGIGIFLAVNTPNGRPVLNNLPGSLLGEFVGRAPPIPPRAADAVAEAQRVAGPYRSLRTAYHRSERALLDYHATFKVTALRNGDITIGPSPYHFIPVGEGVFVHAESHAPVVFREVNGTMRVYDTEGTEPAERIGIFEQTGFLVLLAALAGLAVLVTLGADAWRALRGRHGGNRAALALDGACLVWIAAGLLFYFAVTPWLDSEEVVVFTYPGRLFPAACWTILAACLMTLLAAAASLGPWRPRGWRWPRWFRHAAALLVLAAFGLTLYDRGLVGYSGF